MNIVVDRLIRLGSNLKTLGMPHVLNQRKNTYVYKMLDYLIEKHNASLKKLNILFYYLHLI